MTVQERLKNLPLLANDRTADLAQVKARASQRRRRRRRVGQSCVAGLMALVGVVGYTTLTRSSDTSDLVASSPSTESAEQAEAVPSEPPEGAVLSDGLGGWLGAQDENLVQFTASGETRILVGPWSEPRSGVPSPLQRTLTDVVEIDGTVYALVAAFENLDPNFEGRKPDSRLTIEAINLETGERRTVEEREATGQTADWIYNEHVTSDGINLLVARSLWQGECFYTETIGLDGSVLENADEPVPAPDWLAGWVPEPSSDPNFFEFDGGPCVDIDEWVHELGGGSKVLGQQADSGKLNALNQALDGVVEQPTPEFKTEIDDSLGGQFVNVDGALVHRSADGKEQTLYEDFQALNGEGESKQRHLTDVVSIDGSEYVLVREWDSDNATASIVAIDLAAGEHTILEERVVPIEPENPEWIYNDYVTSDGENILIGRSWGQGICQFTETVDLDGNRVDADEPIEKPGWLSSYDGGEIGSCSKDIEWLDVDDGAWVNAHQSGGLEMDLFYQSYVVAEME